MGLETVVLLMFSSVSHQLPSIHFICNSFYLPCPLKPRGCLLHKTYNWVLNVLFPKMLSDIWHTPCTIVFILSFFCLYNRFSQLSGVEIWGPVIFFVVGVSVVHCNVFSSASQASTMSVPWAASTRYDHPECLLHCQISPERALLPLLRTIALGKKFFFFIFNFQIYSIKPLLHLFSPISENSN